MRWTFGKTALRRPGPLAGALFLFACAAPVARGSDVVVVKRGAGKMSVDLRGLVCPDSPAGEMFGRTLRADLQRSGWFAPVNGAGDLTVSGTCREGRGSLSVDCRVRNTATAKQYLRDEFKDRADRGVALAHTVADAIVSAVKGVSGIAGTRIVMVGSRGGKRDLYLCDADGANLMRLTQDAAVCLSPAWDPRAASILYTSFHRGYPDVYRIDLGSSRRTLESAYPGLNSGADVAPNGRRMALTLSMGGNPDLYIKAFGGHKPVRVTRTPHAAEASPSWSPDGKRIVFVSDRPGTPQLYVTDGTPGHAKRITFQGSENVAPDWGPDGRVAYSSRRGGRYHVCIWDPRADKSEQITHGAQDYEDPSWAPDGRHVVCTRTESYRSDLYVLDVMGDPPLRLTTWEGDWYSPAWSPQ